MFESEAAEFDDKITSLVAERVRHMNARLVASQNHGQYSHGHAWTHIDASTGRRNEGSFKEHSAEITVSVAKIMENDASTIATFVNQISEMMHGQMARSLYETLGEAVRNTPNEAQFSVDSSMSEEQRDAAVLASLDEAFDRIWLAVDRYGAVTYPELHLHPSNELVLGAVRRHSLREPDERREDASEERRRRKEIEAIHREAERICNFRRR